MTLRLAINGFGRIGRNALKIALEREDLEVVAINDLTGARVLAHLLRYDSVYGPYSKKIEVEENGQVVFLEGASSQSLHLVGPEGQESFFLVAGKRIRVLSEKDPSRLPWRDLKVDVVLECTGRLTEGQASAAHLKAGAKKVVISAPSKDGETKTFLLGVNSDQYDGEEIVSNASCTTNCISPVAVVIERSFGILKAAMTTIHAYTAEQNLVDGLPPQLHPDLRRARAAAVNISPTTTGAAVSTTQVLPQLKGLFDGLAVRVPVIAGSLADFTFLVKKKTEIEEVNQVFVEAQQNSFYKGVLDVTWEPLVSTDIIRSAASAIVDLSLTQVIDGDLVKVIAWYDNEWGYSHRLLDLALLVGRSTSG